MTIDKASNEFWRETPARYALHTGEPVFMGSQMAAAFVAGANWQAEQPTANLPLSVPLGQYNVVKDQLADARRQIEEMEKRQENFRSTIDNLVDAERSYILTIDRRTEERNLFADKIRNLEADNNRQAEAAPVDESGQGSGFEVSERAHVAPDISNFYHLIHQAGLSEHLSAAGLAGYAMWLENRP